jgi:hypothetical protein
MNRIENKAQEMGVTLTPQLLEYVTQAFEYYKHTSKSEEQLLESLLSEAEIHYYERQEERGQ